jgi:hypothetical protein
VRWIASSKLQLLITDNNGNVRSHDDVQRLTDTSVSLSQGKVREYYWAPPNTLLGRDYGMLSNFWKFYLIRTSFILGELDFLVKVFRLFSLEWIFFGVQSVYTVGR